MSIESPTTFTKNVLICDNLFTGTVETVPTTVSCGIELQSTTTAFCVSRLTTAQRDALIPTPGMIVYNTSDDAFNMYLNGSFATVNAAVPGVISGPVTSTVNAVVRWNSTDGAVLADSSVLIDGTGNVTGTNTVATALGSAAAPSYAFTGAADTGMYASGAGRIDFATGGARQLKIGNNPTAVNYVQIDGGATTTGVTISAESGTDANVDLNLSPLGTGLVGVNGSRSAGTLGGKVAFYNATGSFYSAFQAGNPGANVSWTLPTIDATIPGQVLSSNAAGTLSWASTGTLSATVTVSSTALLTLNATPVEIIAAPGANTMISIVGATMEYVFNSTAYTVPAATQLQLFVNTLKVGSDIAATGLLDQGVDTFGFTTAANQAIGVPTATVANQPLTIKNSGTAFSAGNGTLVVTVYYNIIPV